MSPQGAEPSPIRTIPSALASHQICLPEALTSDSSDVNASRLAGSAS